MGNTVGRPRSSFEKEEEAANDYKNTESNNLVEKKDEGVPTMVSGVDEMSRRVTSKLPRRPDKLFQELDVEKKGYLTLKELQVENSELPSHSLPALFFCDGVKNGRISEAEFSMLIQYCWQERKRTKLTMLKDTGFRELIQKASAAGVKGSSANCRTNFRRLSSFKDVRSVYYRPREPSALERKGSAGRPPTYGGPVSEGPQLLSASGKLTRNQSIPAMSDSAGSETATSLMNNDSCFTARPADEFVAHEDDEQVPAHRVLSSIEEEGSEYSDEATSSSVQSVVEKEVGESTDGSVAEHEESTLGKGHQEAVGYEEAAERVSSEEEEAGCDRKLDESKGDEQIADKSKDSDQHDKIGHVRTISMVSSKLEYSPNGCTNGMNPIDTIKEVILKCEDLDPATITALDAAAVENVNKTHISKLGDYLHSEKTRVEFMQWLWELIDFNDRDYVGLEELGVFFKALGEDGIYLEELAFYRDPTVPLEKRILNEFDNRHRGNLTRSEFMSLADLVTREYEFWEIRHLDRIGNYELGNVVGRGSSGLVRSAFNTETKEKFAIKIVHKGNMSDLSKLDTEIQSLMLCSHPDIVSLVEVMESNDRTFIVMELCGGGSLIDMVRVYSEEKMPEDTARYYLRQLFEALAYCHGNGICHRDVRAENMLLDNEGSLKLCDFGHSGMYTCGWDIFNTNLVGSIFNLSPEQISGQPYSGEKIDVWSAGVAMYCLLVGRPPFCSADTNQLVNSILSASYAIPETVSEEAADLMKCTIQVSSALRPSMAELLHHPWFFSGPEVAPVMNVVNIPVEMFFSRRPDLAEMVIARTIHEYGIHFRLGKADVVGTNINEQYNRAWILKCHYPKRNIKFSVALFVQKQIKTPANTPNTISVPRNRGESNQSKLDDFFKEASEKLEGTSKGRSSKMPERLLPTTVIDNADGRTGESGGKTPLLQEPNRDGKLPRSRSLGEELEGLLNVIRTNTVDAFPYQRTVRHRRRPSTTPIFHHRRQSLDDTSLYMGRKEKTKNLGTAARCSSEWSPHLYPRRSPATPTPPRLLPEEDTDRSSDGLVNDVDLSAADKSIKRRLSVHPLKASMFLTSNMHDMKTFESTSPRLLSKDKISSPVTPQTPTATPGSPLRKERRRSLLEGSNVNGTLSPPSEPVTPSIDEDADNNDARPFLEMRLHDGESGVFLKICRKFKTICETKLTATAEKHRRRNSGRGSPIMRMRRINSAQILANVSSAM